MQGKYSDVSACHLLDASMVSKTSKGGVHVPLRVTRYCLSLGSQSLAFEGSPASLHGIIDYVTQPQHAEKGPAGAAHPRTMTRWSMSSQGNPLKPRTRRG